MGWLEGVLSGYADRHYEILKEKRDDAAKAAEREGRVFETLLSSPYADIKNYALAGMLDLSNPRKRTGGVSGWMGEIEKGPYLDMIRRTQQRYQDDPDYAAANLYKPGEPLPAQPSIPQTAGSVAPSPEAAGGALPSTSPVTGGPMTTPTPAPFQNLPTARPGQGALHYMPNAPLGPAQPLQSLELRAGRPPAPPGAQELPDTATGLDPRQTMQAAQAQLLPGADPQAAGQGAPGAVGTTGVSTAPPQPPAGPPLPVSAGPPTPPGQVGSGLPGATTRTVGAAPPVPPSRTQLPGIWPTADELARSAAVARAAGTDQGEQESYIRVAEAQGLSRAEGLQMWAEAQMKARGGAGANTPYAWRPMEYTDAQGAKHRMLARTNRASGAIEDIHGNPLPTNAVPVTPGLYPYEIVQRRQASNPLLWNQSLTQARSVLGLNATAEEVIDFADQLFTQSQSMAPPVPGAAPGGPTPPPTTVPGAAPSAAAPVAPAGSAPPGSEPPQGGAPPAVTPGGPAPVSEPAPGPGPAPATTPGAALKQGLEDAGAGASLTRRRDEGRPATTPERDTLGFYLRARQPLDAILAKDPQTGLSLEDRITHQSLGAQLARRFAPDSLDFLLPADAQLYKTAAERFTEARVRKVSGAQIRPDEYETDRKLFFAQPGDTAERIAEKRRLREAELDAVVFAAGPAYQEYFKKPYVPSFMQHPHGEQRLPPPMPPPPPNRAVPRPSATPSTPPPTTGTGTGTPTSVKGPDGNWYIVIP